MFALALAALVAADRRLRRWRRRRRGPAGGPRRRPSATDEDDPERRRSTSHFKLERRRRRVQAPSRSSLGGPVPERPRAAAPVRHRATRSEGRRGRRTSTVSGGLTSTGRPAFVNFQDTDYEVPQQLFDQFSRSFLQLQGQSRRGQAGAACSSRSGIDPANWLTDLENEGDRGRRGDRDDPHLRDGRRRQAGRGHASTIAERRPSACRERDHRASSASSATRSRRGATSTSTPGRTTSGCASSRRPRVRAARRARPGAPDSLDDRPAARPRRRQQAADDRRPRRTRSRSATCYRAARGSGWASSAPASRGGAAAAGGALPAGAGGRRPPPSARPPRPT